MKKWIEWMANNHVAANLLMMVFVVGGLVKGLGVKQEVFPEIALDKVQVEVDYPGAGPEEVEEGIILKIEEAISGIDGIDELSSQAFEGRGSVIAELRTGVDPNVVLQDIKSEVDRITTFPEDAEQPIVSKILNLQETVSVVVYGDLPERTLRERAEMVRNELLDHPKITQVELGGVRPYEVTVEVPEANLRRYGLTMETVAAAVRQASLDLPGGTIKTRSGEILLRTKEKRYKAAEYADIVIVRGENGATVRLGDIAVLTDGFEDTGTYARFDGKPAAMINVFRVGDQKPTEISDIVLDYVDELNSLWPDSVRAAVWNDTSELLESRLNLLKKNALLGLCLVIIVLGLFLELRLALWVMLGIPISFMGALMLLPSFDVSVNMISLFAFILALGIVVDDAIVVGENIFEHREKGKPFLQAAIDGATEMSVPVTFSILTTVAAFLPIAFVAGTMGKFMVAVPIVVISLLLVSLVESLFVLPAHLSGGSSKPLSGPVLGRIDAVRIHFGERLERFVAGPYRRTLDLALAHRYTTFAVGIALLFLSVGIVRSGLIKFTFMPEVEGERITAALQMPVGTTLEATGRKTDMLIETAMDAVAEMDAGQSGEPTIFRHVYAIVGGAMAATGPANNGESGATSTNIAQVALFLTRAEERTVAIGDVKELWRQKVGEIPGADSLTFTTNLVQMGANIDVELRHVDYRVLEAAAEEVKAYVAGYPGVTDIEDNFSAGKGEIKFTLTDEAKTLGVTEADFARQVRGAFFGSEALRLQIGRNEVKVKIRYPEGDRRLMQTLTAMRIRTPMGGEIPIARAARFDRGRGYSTITRNNRKRVVNVTATVNTKEGNAGEINADIREKLLPGLMATYDGLSYGFAGEEKEKRESLGSLKEGYLLALFAIYALLAIPFKSYGQPVIIMFAIPFGIVGAIFGHLLMGYNLSMLSLFGVIALSGVVVNDSLLMIDRINTNRARGMTILEGTREAGQRRFRPILLTSLTTFFGLVPMILETSVQAQFLIPMAISLGFGILFATLITLLLIPSLYMILEDARGALWQRKENQSFLSHDG
ncbi:efflux RND transporter permease subunit [Desulfoluna spongiiphila]|uniref:efflux RND transporter permease subunit n=1 Tax=Desulfoluna spongiiphila TaxID=419481 RepID=UPI001258DCFB|nr:efflux RND transporter permease subunit [Desulfoluna spongiiphila]VVS93912.1 acriflavin resistance protein [Desulfoluna spongiiphila]